MDEDEALTRMRAADPAAGAEPDSERLAKVTADRRSEVPDELAGRRARRAPRWVAVAAVTAGALAVGGAGYGLGRASDDPAPQAVEVPAEGRAGAPEPMTAQEDSMAGTDVATSPGYGARTVFTAQGLSEEAGAATAWAYDGASVFSAETAARVAAVFGVEGEPRQEVGWVVGAGEFDGPFVSLSNSGTAHVDYHDPAQYSLGEGQEPVPLPEPDTSASSEEDGESVTQPGADAPDGPAGVVYETLAALGLDPDAAEYETSVYEQDVPVADVVAHQVVDGHRTGAAWYANVIDGKIYTFNGPLAPLVGLGEYDVVSPAEAVERLGDPRFGGSPVWRGDTGVMPTVPEVPFRDWNEPPGAPPAPREPIAWPVTAVTIVDAEPALTQHMVDDGGVLVLPAYELSDAEGQTWSVLAVADHELAF